MPLGIPAAAEPRNEAMDAESLYVAHAAFVASFLRLMGTPAGDLDDLVQEVFVVAHRRGGYKPGPALPRTWLTAIAFRVGQAGRRSRAKRSRHTLEADDLPSTAHDPAASLETHRSLQRVQRILDGMPEEQRAAFVLYELEGESCESIACALNIPIGTVYSRLHHARSRVLEAYQMDKPSPKTRRDQP